MNILRQSNGGLYFRSEKNDRRASAYPTFVNVMRQSGECVYRPAEMDDRPGEIENRWCWVPPAQVPTFEWAKQRYIDDYLESDRIIRNLDLQVQ